MRVARIGPVVLTFCACVCACVGYSVCAGAGYSAGWAQRKYYRNWTLGVSMRFRSSWDLILHQSTQEKSSCRKLIFSPQLVLDGEISIFAFFAPSGAPTGSPREAPPRTLLWAVRRRLYGPCRLNPGISAMRRRLYGPWRLSPVKVYLPAGALSYQKWAMPHFRKSNIFNLVNPIKIGFEKYVFFVLHKRVVLLSRG